MDPISDQSKTNSRKFVKMPDGRFVVQSESDPVIKKRHPDRLLKKLHFDKLYNRTRTFRWKHNYIVYAASIVGVLFLGVLVYKGLLSSDSGKQAPKTVAAPFSTLAPNGDIKNSSSKKAKYSPKQKTVSYVDKIGGVAVTVSEQELPQRFKQDQASQLQSFAKEIYANEQVTAGDVKVYIGQSVKGPQTAVFIKNNLLIFVTSNSKVSNEDWKQYITELK